MSTSIISTIGLDYQFSRNSKVLSGVSLDVPKGSIYGFLGHNGAGKTTTLRLLLGLLKIQNGSIHLFGENLTENRMNILRRVGSLIEQPSLYLHLNAKDNLEIFRLAYGCSKARIGEVLDIVGLRDAAGKKVKAYSLGMKQRLAIAIALLHDPELLILDEPTNGLDPSGIIETRELIRSLNKDFGKTIIVSSHMLNEVEKMVSHVGIIHKGSMLFQGTIGQLHENQRRDSKLELEVCSVEKAREILAPFFPLAESSGSAIVFPYHDRETAANINSLLVNNGVQVYQLAVKHHDLENVFIQLTNSN